MRAKILPYYKGIPAPLFELIFPERGVAVIGGNEFDVVVLAIVGLTIQMNTKVIAISSYCQWICETLVV